MKKVKLKQSLDYYIWKTPLLVAKVIHLAKRRTRRQFYNRLQYVVKRHNDE